MLNQFHKNVLALMATNLKEILRMTRVNLSIIYLFNKNVTYYVQGNHRFGIYTLSCGIWISFQLFSKTTYRFLELTVPKTQVFP